jgi:hypothetical protein
MFFIQRKKKTCALLHNDMYKYQTVITSYCDLSSGSLTHALGHSCNIRCTFPHVACPSSSLPHVHLWSFFYKVNYWFIHLYKTASCVSKVLQNQILFSMWEQCCNSKWNNKHNKQHPHMFHNTYLKLSSMSAEWSDCQLTSWQLCCSILF